MVPLFAGVIIAGLGIGALLSAFAARHVPTPAQSQNPLVVMHTPTPIAATRKPAATPTATATAVPTLKPSLKSSLKASSKPTPSSTPTVKPAATATPSPVATAVPTREPTARPTLAARTSPPTATPTAPPPVAAQALPPPEALVRKYMEAIAHGDDATAYAALGGNSGSLTEVQYLDPTMRITSVSSTRVPGGGTNVQVEFRTARGEYFGTFTVDSSATRITQHEVIPVGGTSAR